MRKELRAYLDSLGLRSGASQADAWAFYNGLAGEQRTRAMQLRSAPPAGDPTPTPPPAQPPAGEGEPPAGEGQRGAPPTPPPAPVRNEDEIRREERTRVHTIRQYGEEVHVAPETIQRAIDEGWSIERASAAFLQVMRDRPAPVHGPAIHSRGHETDCTLEALQAGMLLRSGVALDSPLFRRVTSAAVAESTGLPLWLGRAFHDSMPDPQAQERAARALDNSHYYADMSMVDLCYEAIRLDAGQSGTTRPHSRTSAIRAAVSGGSLANIFTTVVGAQLLMAYEAAPDTTGGWTRETDVSDFKVQERTQLGKGATLQKLGRGGTAKHTTFSDRKESYRIARYAKQFVVDEQDFIDDSFNALMDAPQELGEAAAQLRPDMVYAILFANAALDQDSVALFHTASHANLRTSATLAAATLKTALTDMGIQQQDGRPLNLFGKYLIIPQTLLWTARQLTQSATLIGQGASAEPVGSANPLAEERLEIRADQRLDNGVTDPVDGTTYSGATGDWFLSATGGRHTIEVGFRTGTGRSPQLRSFNLDRGQWGMGWDICHDIGAKALDYRGLHKSEA